MLDRLIASICLLPLATLAGIFDFIPFIGNSAADFDFNGDGVVRVALVSTAKPGGMDAVKVCEDLERILKQAGKPARVSHENISCAKSLMGWYYHPSSAEAKEGLLSPQLDLLLLAESDAFALAYPEFFFEGVRAISAKAQLCGIKTALLLASRPGGDTHDKRLSSVADRTWRVADGCGLEVIPASFAWKQTLEHNRLRGDSPMKTRACAFLAAATVYSYFADKEIPSEALQCDWTVKSKARELAQSALEATQAERIRKHYAGPFKGVVRIEPRISKRLKIFLPNSDENDPLRLNFEDVLDAANLDSFWKTPADWYRDGSDRYSASFDIVFGDTQQIEQYLDPSRYTSLAEAPKEWKTPAICAYSRIPESQENDVQTRITLENLEALLTNGYDFAKKNSVLCIPYALAWARAEEIQRTLIAPAKDGRTNDWLSYMLANMIYTATSDRWQPPSEKAKPLVANTTHPHGFHALCARIGYDVMEQLSGLRSASNTILLRSASYRVSKGASGFASIRLLDKPAADVTVFCATDKPEQISLSAQELLFTPDNYNIEQTVRIAPSTNSAPIFACFMAAARSQDGEIDGRNDLRPMVFNFDDRTRGSMRFDRTAVSPRSGFAVNLNLDEQPADLVKVSIRQGDLLTQERWIAPNDTQGATILLHPTADDYRKGRILVSVTTHSQDLRFDNRELEQEFKLSSSGFLLPDVKLLQPTQGTIEGPAFVTASAESDRTSGVVRTSLFMGQKELGRKFGFACTASAGNGPPPSRLPSGTYYLWAEAQSTNGAILATPPSKLVVE